VLRGSQYLYRAGRVGGSRPVQLREGGGVYPLTGAGDPPPQEWPGEQPCRTGYNYVYINDLGSFTYAEIPTGMGTQPLGTSLAGLMGREWVRFVGVVSAEFWR
jgi:hypothetical protein